MAMGPGLRHALADRRAVPGGGIPAPDRLRKPGLAHGPGTRLGRARREHPAARRRRHPGAGPARPGVRRPRAGWSRPGFRAWPSGRSAWPGGSAAEGADAEPDPVRLFRELVLSEGRRCWPASCGNAPAAEPRRPHVLPRSPEAANSPELTAIRHVSGDLAAAGVRSRERQLPASSPARMSATGPACACRQPGARPEVQPLRVPGGRCSRPQRARSGGGRPDRPRGRRGGRGRTRSPAPGPAGR